MNDADLMSRAPQLEQDFFGRVTYRYEGGRVVGMDVLRTVKPLGNNPVAEYRRMVSRGTTHAAPDKGPQPWQPSPHRR